jgi:hypothetical protein
MPTTTDRTVRAERRAWENQGRFLLPDFVYTGDLTTREIYRRLVRDQGTHDDCEQHWSLVIARELAERDLNPTVWLPRLAAWLDRRAVETSAMYTRHAGHVRDAAAEETLMKWKRAGDSNRGRW